MWRMWCALLQIRNLLEVISWRPAMLWNGIHPMKTTAHWNLWIHTWNKNNRIKHGKEHTYQSQWHKILDTGYKQLKKQTRLWSKIPLLDSVGLQGSTLASDISHRQSDSLKGLIITTGEQMAHSFWWSMWFYVPWIHTESVRSCTLQFGQTC